MGISRCVPWKRTFLIRVIYPHIADRRVTFPSLLSTAAVELAQRSKRTRRAQTRCASPAVESVVNAVWQQREKTRRCPRAEPHKSNIRKAVEMTGKNLGTCCKIAGVSFFWSFVCKRETRVRGRQSSRPRQASKDDLLGRIARS